MSTTRWQGERTAADSQAYVERFRALERDGVDSEGEARFVDALLPRASVVLDAGCGTGRVGASLARRGHRVTAVDLDPILVEEARTQPGIDVHLADLATMDVGTGLFDAVVAAGNVMVFLEPGSEVAVLERFHAHLRPGGVLVCGFATDREYTATQFVSDASTANLVVEHRFSTWNLGPWRDDADWIVVVARRPE